MSEPSEAKCLTACHVYVSWHFAAGVLTHEEFVRAVRALDPHASHHRINKMFREAYSSPETRGITKARTACMHVHVHVPACGLLG